MFKPHEPLMKIISRQQRCFNPTYPGSTSTWILCMIPCRTRPLRFAPWDGFDPMHPVNSSPSYGRLAASPRQVEVLFSLQSVPARSQPTTLLTVATTRTCSHFHTQWQRSPGSVSGMTYRPPNVVVDCISQPSWSHAVLYLPLQPYEIWPAPLDPETLQ